jgi:hypothetical protein
MKLILTFFTYYLKGLDFLYSSKWLYAYIIVSLFFIFFLPPTSFLNICSFLGFFIFLFSLFLLKSFEINCNKGYPFFKTFAQRVDSHPVNKLYQAILAFIFSVLPKNSLCTEGDQPEGSPEPESKQKEESSSWGKDVGKAAGEAAKGVTGGDVVAGTVGGIKVGSEHYSANKDRQGQIATEDDKTCQQSHSAANESHRLAIESGDPKQTAFTGPIVEETKQKAKESSEFVQDLKQKSPSVLPDVKIPDVNSPEYKKDMKEAEELTEFSNMGQ